MRKNNGEQLEKLTEKFKNSTSDLECYLFNAFKNDDAKELGYAYVALEELKDLVNMVKVKIKWFKNE